MLGVQKGRSGQPGDVVIVTGSGTGIGLATALHLAEQGFRVYATVRSLASAETVRAAARARELELDVLELDLADRDSVRSAVGTVAEQAGGIFALINNGGIGLRGCTEACSEDEIRHLFDVNVLGTIAVTQAVLPHMRAAGCGRVVTITSVGGRVPGWGVTMYCASKFAQEGLAEGWAQELAPFGIQSVIVEPGMINTERWDVHRGTAAGAMDRDSPYHSLFWASEAIADRIVQRSPTRSEDVARTVELALTAEDPRLRYVVGRGARVVIALRRYLPQQTFERLYFGGHIRRLMRTAGEPAAAPRADASALVPAPRADASGQVPAPRAEAPAPPAEVLH